MNAYRTALLVVWVHLYVLISGYSLFEVWSYVYGWFQLLKLNASSDPHASGGGCLLLQLREYLVQNAFIGFYCCHTCQYFGSALQGCLLVISSDSLF
jgi:hypothetical protein